MTASFEPRAWLRAIACLPDEQIDLAEAALWIAAEEEPGFDPATTLARLDELGGWLERRLEGVAHEIERMVLLASFLADEIGLRGTQCGSAEPQNGLLNQVLQGNLGIPSVLALAYIEVGRRAGIALTGVCLPEHFLVRHEFQPHLVLDPFDRGRLLTRADCKALVDATPGEGAEVDGGALRPSSPRQIVVRLLDDLRRIYLRRGELTQAISVLDRILVFDPHNLEALRDRGLLSLRWGDPELAWDDLGLYLDLVPDAPDYAALTAVMEDRPRWGTPIH